jgi:glycosyltransferase involved in cell wall biosynthesis
MRLDGAGVPDAPGEIRACLVVRNEALRIASVLAHHRRLGVERFLVIDNGSTDGTLDYLTAQPDVALFRTDESYAAARSGLDWINAVLDAHGDGRWTLTIDADELFIYPGFERVDLRDFCAFLEGQGAQGVMALLLDMYGEGEVGEALHTPGAPLTDVCPWFDPGPYRYVRAGPFPHVQFMGGPRARLFDFEPYQPRPPVISKVPLVRWRRGLRYGLSTHAITPIELPAMVAGLLHFKFLSDFRARVAAAVDGGQFHGGSREYRAYRDYLDRNGDLRLHDERSVRFVDSGQLVSLGVMQPGAAYEAFLSASLQAE